jgi:hypothetical protein
LANSLLGETPMKLFNGNLLDTRRDCPLVPESVNDGRYPISMNDIGWFLDRLCTGFDGTPVNGIYIADVDIERAAGLLTVNGLHY